jgi:formylmethanofuran dehydrogenase subunit E
MIYRCCLERGMGHRHGRRRLRILDYGKSATRFYRLEPLRPVGMPTSD